MPDPFSIAGGAIALAGTGFKIAKGIKEYVDSVNGAEKRLRPIQLHVEFLAGLLGEVGTILESDGVRNLCTPGLFKAAKSALDNCSENFNEVESFLAGIITVEGGKVKMNTFNKLTLAFKQTELDILQAHMDRSKADLNVVFTVLQAANALRTAPKESTIVEERKAKVQASISAQRNVVTAVPVDATPKTTSTGAQQQQMMRDLHDVGMFDTSGGLSTTPKEPDLQLQATATSKSFVLYPLGERINQSRIAEGPSISRITPMHSIVDSVTGDNTREGAAESVPLARSGLPNDTPSTDQPSNATMLSLLESLSSTAAKLNIRSRTAFQQWQSTRCYVHDTLKLRFTDVQDAFCAVEARKADLEKNGALSRNDDVVVLKELTAEEPPKETFMSKSNGKESFTRMRACIGEELRVAPLQLSPQMLSSIGKAAIDDAPHEGSACEDDEDDSAPDVVTGRLMQGHILGDDDDESRGRECAHKEPGSTIGRASQESSTASLEGVSMPNYDDFGLGCVRSWPGTPVAADTQSDSPLPTPTVADDAGKLDVPDFSEADQLLREWTTLEI